jgi:K+-transporting ATPase ATPase C chain
MLFASGSGLDPHISPAAARLQIAAGGRRARDSRPPWRRWSSCTLRRRSGVFSAQPRVNVLKLNLALDGLQ